MLLQPPPSERKKKRKKKKTKKKTNCPLHPTRPPPKLPKISVVNKSPDEEEHLNSGAKEEACSSGHSAKVIFRLNC